MKTLLRKLKAVPDKVNSGAAGILVNLGNMYLQQVSYSPRPPFFTATIFVSWKRSFVCSWFSTAFLRPMPRAVVTPWWPGFNMLPVPGVKRLDLNCMPNEVPGDWVSSFLQPMWRMECLISWGFRESCLQNWFVAMKVWANWISRLTVMREW